MRTRTHHQWLGPLVVVVGLLLASILPVAAYGQRVTVERSGSVDTGIGDTVSWESPWNSAGEQQITDDPDVSVVMIRSDEHFAFVAQGAISDAAGLRGLMQERVRELKGAPADPAVEDQVTVDSSVADPVSYWLDLIPIEGAPYGSFALGRTGGEVDVLTVLVGPVEAFAEGIADAQAGLRIGDEAVFDGVGGEGLQTLLEQNLSALPEASPVAETGTAEATESTTDATEEATEASGEAEEDIPYADVGKVGARSYVSPQFGVAIEWTSDWDLDPTFGDPVLSDRKLGEDTVYLLWNEEYEAWMVIFIWPNFDASMQEFIDYVGSPEAVTDTFGDNASVAMSGASPTLGATVTLIDEGVGDPALIYSEFRVSADFGAIIEVRLISVDSSITESAIEAVQADIRVEGEPALVFYPPADVAEAHGLEGGDDAVLGQRPSLASSSRLVTWGTEK